MRLLIVFLVLQRFFSITDSTTIFHTALDFFRNVTKNCLETYYLTNKTQLVKCKCIFSKSDYMVMDETVCIAENRDFL